MEFYHIPSPTRAIVSTPRIELDMEAAIGRMGDKEIYLEIAFYFADQLPKSVDELRKALEKELMLEATRFAHSMKSNCATVGAEALRQECYALEKLCASGEVAAARAAFAALSPRLAVLRRILLALT